MHDKYPDYDNAFDELFKFNNFVYGHNMFIMKWNMFNSYCSWVFDILLEAERLINPSNYSIDKIRVFESQLTWVTDELSSTHFNDKKYVLACKCSFFFNKPRN
ncbi:MULTISPECIES: DUF4422 domain-containing protein [Parabacteroides]|uniref:DUF4422 domain-containing protein n=1 Tax=Parabacteroides distasonis TaxID=823 RepID=A0A5C6KBV1_PARDI|nr:DUF4422 domain-containing protein [Parabacteroides sp. AF39-10AC]TWV59854.1 DUF4422 domain-containing protein [Parabacteroides distasonis]